MSFVSFGHKDLKKLLFMKVNIKSLPEYVCRQLTYRQRRIRRKTGISLEIIPNVLKCLRVSLFPLKVLLFNITIFVYFSWCSL